ncbi:S-layer homology domain-containing protein [Paenibacillus silvae]|uniref:S-layer homology domain-containing protein n=1 Tax=Paenibacillus silvae TaxID=1325358 RepID=UPI0020037F82|nr:S-layer homology domain-containing protein [Paenibacillus silvae]MCK6077745.1 S-layer homology domain-containing protein [Paenibacillus silvae]MCK6151944.1 S-layer homology domain-containing protein [Paenibacillus silvae]MCK6270629.1 S-layer homology domain-containing protein [Paenibacillus silvae]
MRRRIISSLTAFALLAGGVAAIAGTMGNSSAKAAQDASTFKDVPASHWASTAIYSAVEQGYFKGYTDGTFKPGAPVTKAEMASILARLTDQPELQTPEANNFTDVPEWAKSSVSTAIAKGFIHPSSYKGKLDAKAPLSRGEMADWLTQGLSAVNSDYGQALSDVTNTVIPAKEYFTGKLADSHKNAVAVALGTGLMSVANDKTFGVDRTTTRAEVAVLIARYASTAQTKPSDIQGLNELRQVGLTGTNLSVITKSFHKTPEKKTLLSSNQKYEDVVTDDFSFVRNKDIVTLTNYADLKILNWIIVDTHVSNDKRSIYYPVFVDEGAKLQSGRHFSFVEFKLNIKSESMSQLQAGSLLGSATFNPLFSPRSKVFLSYGGPKISDYFAKTKAIFIVKNPVYWSEGLLHANSTTARTLTLETKGGTVFSINYTN